MEIPFPECFLVLLFIWSLYYCATVKGNGLGILLTLCVDSPGDLLFASRRVWILGSDPVAGAGFARDRTRRRQSPRGLTFLRPQEDPCCPHLSVPRRSFESGRTAERRDGVAPVTIAVTLAATCQSVWLVSFACLAIVGLSSFVSWFLIISGNFICLLDALVLTSAQLVSRRAMWKFRTLFTVALE